MNLIGSNNTLKLYSHNSSSYEFVLSVTDSPALCCPETVIRVGNFFRRRVLHGQVLLIVYHISFSSVVLEELLDLVRMNQVCSYQVERFVYPNVVSDRFVVEYISSVKFSPLEALLVSRCAAVRTAV